jgi:hypothetical protein
MIISQIFGLLATYRLGRKEESSRNSHAADNSLLSLTILECLDSRVEEHDNEAVEMFFSAHGHNVLSLKLLLVHPSPIILPHCCSSLVELTIKDLHLSFLRPLSFPYLQRLGLFSGDEEDVTGLTLMVRTDVGLVDTDRFPVLQAIQLFELHREFIEYRLRNDDSLEGLKDWLHTCRLQGIAVTDKMGEIL